MALTQAPDSLDQNSDKRTVTGTNLPGGKHALDIVTGTGLTVSPLSTHFTETRPNDYTIVVKYYNDDTETILYNTRTTIFTDDCLEQIVSSTLVTHDL